jgi:hypothetical protein
MWFRKKKVVKEYDKEHLEPVLMRSICTGETTAGFRNRQTGQYVEDRLILSDSDLEDFRETYGITGDLKVIY